MTAFLIAAAALLAAALALLARPFWRRSAAGAGSRRALNAAIYRDQLAELERDRESGQLGEADYREARGEIQRRLIEDTGGAEESAAAVRRAPKRTLLALVFTIPVAAALLYAWLGNPAALDPGARKQIDAGEISQMVDSLAARLAAKPDDHEGWAMLARSYKALGRYGDAAAAYAKAGPLLDGDAELIADYAETLALDAGSSLAGRPTELIAKALKVDPENPRALLLAGAAAMERRDYAAAVEHWERLVKLVPPDSEDAETLAESIGRAKQKLEAGKRSATSAISGRVELAPALKGRADPNDAVFVFAREPDGGPMPLAAIRLRVADLPLDFRLDDANALSDRPLSSAKAVTIEARVAKSGSAGPRPGDLAGSAGPVKPGAKGVRLRIDAVLP